MGGRKMSGYDYEIEGYIVRYGTDKEKEFDNEQDAVEFARKKYEEDYMVSIKQISHLVGWI